MAESRVGPRLSKANSTDIHVRCQGADNEFVKVNAGDLPKDPYDLIYLLKVETAPRSCWRDVAAAYYRNGMLSACITVLQEATSDDVESVLRGGVDDQPAEPGAPYQPARCSRLDLLAALAGAHIMAADDAALDPIARKDCLQKASDVFSRADKIDIDDPSIWVARGWAEFHSDKVTAVNWFDNARDKAVVLGAMGLAVIQLNRVKPGDPSKKDTVSLLVSALQSNHCPPGIWTGLAYALFREGRLKAARSVAHRAVLALTGSCKQERLEALYLVALIESADENSSSLELMTSALDEAYEECDGASDPRVLALIAEVYFKGGDFASAEVFASRALGVCNTIPGASIGAMFAGIQNSIRATALFQLGRAHHHLGKMDEASNCFEEIKKLVDQADETSLKINPGVFLRLGLLKLATERKEDEPLAQECLEKVIKDSNDRCGVARRALGVLLGRRILVGLKRGRPRGGEQFHRAISLLKRGLAEDDSAKKDVPAQLVYASLVEETSPKLALEAYETAVRTLEEEKAGVDPEIWNNMSSLLARLGDVTKARELSVTRIDSVYTADCDTILYNRARIAEMTGELEEAESLFQRIKKESSHYYEAITRLAVIAIRDDKKLDHAETLLKEAMESSSSKPVAAAVLSKLYAKRKDFRQAQAILEANRHECDYLALAFSSFMHRFLDSLDQERKSRFLINHIGAPLITILKRSKHNSFAANGVGLYFAESKMMSEARDAFTAAGAGSFTVKTARVNLAHTQVNLGHRAISESARVTGRPSHKVVSNSRALFEQAEKLYQDACDASDLKGTKGEFNEHCELLLYAAWAQFEAAQFRKAADTLTKLLHLTPSSAVLWFNLGQALLESASARAIRGKAMLGEMKTARDEFSASRYAFKRCRELDRQHSDPLCRSQLDAKLAHALERYVFQQERTHNVNLRNATDAADDREAKRKASLAVLEAKQKKREEEAKMAEDLQRKKNEELRKAFEESEVKKRRYKEDYDRKLAEEAMFDDEEDDYGGEQGAVRKPRSKRKKKETSLDEEKPAKKPRKQKKAAIAKKKNPEDSGSEYSDVPDESGNENENGTRGSNSENSAGGVEGAEGQQHKKKRFSLVVEEDESDGDL